MTTAEILKSVSKAKSTIMCASTETKNAALEYMADELVFDMQNILEANEKDVLLAKSSISSVMIDRLILNEDRILDMANGIRKVAELDDPVGRVIDTYVHDNGMTIEKTSVPIGVIAIIYESRPNVTSDAAALAIKSGNACILRCGKEAHYSAEAITIALKKGIEKSGLSSNILFLIEDTSRNSAYELMQAVGLVDLLIPRG